LSKRSKLSKYEKAQLKLLKRQQGLKSFEVLSSQTKNIVDALTKAGVAYYGMSSFGHPAGALIGLIGLELAKSQNIVSGLSGVATLSAIGLAQNVRTMDLVLDDKPLISETWKQTIKKLLRLPPMLPFGEGE